MPRIYREKHDSSFWLFWHYQYYKTNHYPSTLWKKQNATRRAAVYLWTHCNIGSKGMFPTSVLDRWHNCLYIYWRNVVQRATPTSVFLRLRDDSAKRRRQRSPKSVCLYFLHQHSPTTGTSLGCRPVPEMIRIARNCDVWAVPLSQTPLKSTHFQLFWNL